MQVAMFFGAGFSLPFGLPVMRSFFDFARSSNDLVEAEKSLLHELQLKARHGNSMLDGDEKNLEHVLSFSLLNPRRSAEGAPSVPLDERLRHVLLKLFRAIDPRLVDEHQPAFRRLLGLESNRRWQDEHKRSIITTNYDLILDQLMQVTGERGRLAVPSEPLYPDASPPSGSVYSTKGHSPLLCKLHGSVNWFDDPSGDTALVRVEGRMANFDYRPAGEDFPKRALLPKICSRDYEPPGPPLIVPPMFAKHTPDPRILRVWQDAAEVLGAAERIAFVGYSFPPSDTHMRYFLASALADNLSLDRIDIVGPEADDIVKRLKGESFGSTFKDRLRAHAGYWESGGYSILD